MSARRLLLAIAGMIIWASAFVVLYVGLSVGCAAGIQQHQTLGANSLTAVLVALFGLHLAALGGLQWYALSNWRRRRDPTRSSGYMAVLTCMLTAVAIVSLLFIGLPLLMVPPCV
jgi:uncharacterized membrane protein YidH (DUF202 family)